MTSSMTGIPDNCVFLDHSEVFFSFSSIYCIIIMSPYESLLLNSLYSVDKNNFSGTSRQVWAMWEICNYIMPQKSQGCGFWGLLLKTGWCHKGNIDPHLVVPG